MHQQQSHEMVLVGSNPTFEKMVPCLTNKDAYSNLLWTLFPPAREEYVSFEGRAIGDRAVKHLEKGTYRDQSISDHSE